MSKAAEMDEPLTPCPTPLHSLEMIWLAWTLVLTILVVLLQNRRWAHLPVSTQFLLLAGAAAVYVCILFWMRLLRNRKAIFLLVDALNRGDQDDYLRKLSQMERYGARLNRRSVVDYCRILRASGLTEFGQHEAAYQELKRMRPERLHPTHALAWHLEMGTALANRNQVALSKVHLRILQESNHSMAKRVLVPLLSSKIAAMDGRKAEAAKQLLAVVKTMRRHPILKHTADRTQLEAAELFAEAGSPDIAQRIAHQVAQRTRYPYLKNRALKWAGG